MATKGLQRYNEYRRYIRRIRSIYGNGSADETVDCLDCNAEWLIQRKLPLDPFRGRWIRWETLWRGTDLSKARGSLITNKPKGARR